MRVSSFAMWVWVWWVIDFVVMLWGLCGFVGVGVVGYRLHGHAVGFVWFLANLGLLGLCLCFPICCVQWAMGLCFC